MYLDSSTNMLRLVQFNAKKMNGANVLFCSHINLREHCPESAETSLTSS